MEREQSCSAAVKDEFRPNPHIDAQTLILKSIFFLDGVGEVIVTCNSDGLFWELVDFPETVGSECLGIKLVPDVAAEVKFSDAYAVEFDDFGVIHKSKLAAVASCMICNEYEKQMYRFTVHSFQRSKSQPAHWALTMFTFGHEDQQTCQMWVNQINASLDLEVERPKNLLVFVNPKSGKGIGSRTWEAVAPIFLRAEIITKVIVTERAGHAFDVMASIAKEDLKMYDGIVAVGGDGFFNEILNGFLLSRHLAHYPPAPSDIVDVVQAEGNYSNEAITEDVNQGEDQSPLLLSAKYGGSGLSTSPENSTEYGFDSAFDRWFRFGIIPAGSTDAIVMCSTGYRDPITSTLQIVLGKRVHLDIAQVVRWKETPTSKLEPLVRYAASFAGYGFYGDVITESEKFRWMGPRRYDYAGTRVFLRHSSYEAEVAYVDIKSEDTNTNGKRVLCCHNCSICSTKAYLQHSNTGSDSRQNETRWLKSKGRFLSIGAAVISCRNEKAPDGLVADAHLSDGFLHLILIRDCHHALYLWHLTQLAKKGGNPMDFKFVEHHKTTAFTFTSFGNQSVWNLDGELFEAHQLSAQVFRGLISLFASGPDA
ncbi:ceramide kinase isoform X1 [Cucurbita pepo subsp. pepo]|uniref:ceramide kinase isoform X1 n=1 Tax=Cucurbita pepo subsp. pepo TaxID=3664 RepID=UPI000C9D36A7|nr:ceramide kinase isoform X1 [Cucurbita pepo subsp. pepo]